MTNGLIHLHVKRFIVIRIFMINVKKVIQLT